MDQQQNIKDQKKIELAQDITDLIVLWMSKDHKHSRHAENVLPHHQRTLDNLQYLRMQVADELDEDCLISFDRISAVVLPKKEVPFMFFSMKLFALMLKVEEHFEAARSYIFVTSFAKLFKKFTDFPEAPPSQEITEVVQVKKRLKQ